MNIRYINKKWNFFIWILFWIPISYFLPSHEHFPLGGVFAPLSAIFLPFIGDGAQASTSFDWKYVYFPALVFWLGGALFIFSVQKFLKK